MTQPKVTVYTKTYCPHCQGAKRLLSEKGVPFEEIDVTHAEDVLKRLIERTKRQTVPQIFIGERFIGGFEELKSLEQSGELAQIMGT